MCGFWTYGSTRIGSNGSACRCCRERVWHIRGASTSSYLSTFSDPGVHFLFVSDVLFNIAAALAAVVTSFLVVFKLLKRGGSLAMPPVVLPTFVLVPCCLASSTGLLNTYGSSVVTVAGAVLIGTVFSALLGNCSVFFRVPVGVVLLVKMRSVVLPVSQLVGKTGAYDAIGSIRALGPGYSNAGIAKRLSISENMVCSHMCSIYSKLGVHTRRQVIDMVEATIGGAAL